MFNCAPKLSEFNEGEIISKLWALEKIEKDKESGDGEGDDDSFDQY